MALAFLDFPFIPHDVTYETGLSSSHPRYNSDPDYILPYCPHFKKTVILISEILEHHQESCLNRHLPKSYIISTSNKAGKSGSRIKRRYMLCTAQKGGYYLVNGAYFTRILKPSRFTTAGLERMARPRIVSSIYPHYVRTLDS